MAFSFVTVMFSKNGDTAQPRWREDLAGGNTVTCSLSSTVGVTTYRWRLVGRPEGSGAGGAGPEPIALGSSSSASFTSDAAGTYIVECLVNGGAPDATILRGGCAILESITTPSSQPLRLLGPGETDEDISDPTVAQGPTKMLNRWLRLVAAEATAPAVKCAVKQYTAAQLGALFGHVTAGTVGILSLPAGAEILNAQLLITEEFVGSGITDLSFNLGTAGHAQNSLVPPGLNSFAGINYGYPYPVGTYVEFGSEDPSAQAVSAIELNATCAGGCLDGLTAGKLNVYVFYAATGGGGGGATLAADYALGVSSPDQTLTLTDLNGGELVIDATSSSFSGSYALRTIAPIGVSYSQLGAGFTWSGGLELGPDNILIGGPAALPTVTAGVYAGIGIGNYVGIGAIGAIGIGNGAVAAGLSSFAAGADCVVNTDYSVGIGTYVNINGLDSIGIGAGATVWANSGIAIGPDASVSGESGIAIGTVVSGLGARSITIGTSLYPSGVGENNVLIGYTLGIGNGTSEVRDFKLNTRIGAGGDLFASYSVSVGPNHYIGANGDVAIAQACLALGNNCTVQGSYGIAMGSNATAPAHEMVVGSSGCPIHAFTICGYNGGAINTLKVTDAPANDFQTGLSIPYRFSGGTVAFEDVYAKDVPPLGSLKLYIPGPPA